MRSKLSPPSIPPGCIGPRSPNRSLAGGPYQRRVAAVVLGLDVCAPAQQQLHNLEILSRGRRDQRRVAMDRTKGFQADSSSHVIVVYQPALESLWGSDKERLEHEIHRVVLHELAHHLRMSHQRMKEIGL